jgi:hypothetical protein
MKEMAQASLRYLPQEKFSYNVKGTQSEDF